MAWERVVGKAWIGLGAAALIAAASCSASDDGRDTKQAVEPSSSAIVRAAQIEDRALHELLTMRAVGGLARQGDALRPAQRIQAFDYRPAVGLRANSEVELELGNAKRRVTLTPLDASGSSVELDNGRAVFEDAYPSTDATWLADGRSLQQLLVLRDGAAPSTFRWRMELGSDLLVPAVEDGDIVVRDVDGAERLRIGNVNVYGGGGSASVSDDDGFLVLKTDARASSAPLVVSWGLVAPEMQLMAAPAQVKARVMILMDTSGSMGMYFHDATTLTDIPGGDGSTSYTDINLTNAYMYPGILSGGTRQGVLSRMYAAKSAVANAVNGYSNTIEFGLETFDFTLCPFNAPLCQPCGWTYVPQIRSYVYDCLYTDNANVQDFTSINWEGIGCNTGSDGGRILIQPGTSSGPQLLPWIDGVENHQSGTGGLPVDPEIRADGPTPLAQSITVAKTQWYDVVRSSDPQLACRPYALIVLTDGVQAGGTCAADPPTAAADLYGANPQNPVKTYVIGVAIDTGGQARNALNNIAKAGGTGTATFADNEPAIEQAFSDIAASSVKYESCNGVDDDCDQAIDDGLGVYQQCTTNSECASGTCDAGRCACTLTSQCASGFSCGAGFCVPSCSTGVGACYRTGVRKCSAGGTACCVNDGQASCTLLTAGPTAAEVCNGIDDDCDTLIDEGGVCQTCNPTLEVCDGKDNDCDGRIDNDLIDVGQPCGYELGVCTKGVTACQPDPGFLFPHSSDKLVCTGGTQPSTEVCNGLDDDCNGIVDGMSRACYTGAAGTQDVGVCVGGQQQCTAVAGSGVENWGTCNGETTPGTETCNGLDDDCNGTVDDVANAGSDCCPDGSPVSTCSQGVCTPGKWQCQGSLLVCAGSVGPAPETCDGLDNDCNGAVDDVTGPPMNEPCGPVAQDGVGICQAGVTKCGTNGFYCDGAVNPEPESCNGLDDDCNGQVDDIAGVGSACCPSGRCGVGPCTAGVLQCSGITLECAGAVGPQTEVCDGIDNDCNGAVDDVPGKGAACCPGGETPAPSACSQGICRPGTMQCQGNSLVCVGGVPSENEICDGIDNDCDGTIDDEADVAQNDPAIGVSCDEPTAPNDQSPCAPGTTVCRGAKVVCDGSVAPAAEVCDGVDQDCDGVVDNEAPCPPEKACINGVCADKCKTGEFPCPGGFDCVDGYCVREPSDAGTGGSGTGGSGTGGSGTGGSGASAGSGGASTGGGSGAGATGGGAAAGGAAAGGAAGASTDAGVGGGAASSAGSGKAEDEGGCGCRLPGRSKPPNPLGLLLMGAAWLVVRRKRGEA